MSSDIASELSQQTKELVARFESRAESFSRRDDLAKLTVKDDPVAAERLARDYFGEGEHVATGIDGSMDFDERLQMMLFYSNATAYSCPFTVGEHIEFNLDAARRESKLAASAAIPLWAEDVGSVFSDQPEIDIDLEHSMERIPNSFMTLGELYLANLVSGKSKIIFLDRLLSGTFSSLSRDARILLKKGESKLEGWSGGKVDLLDIFLGIHLGSPSMEMPTRARYLPLAVVKTLMMGPASAAELAASLKAREEDVLKSWKRLAEIDKRYGHGLIDEPVGTQYRLKARTGGYWNRVSDLALAYAEAVFVRRKHPLALGNDEYLNILDVSTLSLFLLEQLLETARKAGSFVVGIAKDTTATDVTRAILPYTASTGFLKLKTQPPKLRNDRAFLAILSSENPSIKTPWRTLGYDSAFSTIVDFGGKLYSARKVVSREKLFVRAFFQLRTLKSDPAVRSQVFLFDRALDEKMDGSGLRNVPVQERTGPTVVNPYFEEGDASDLSNMILHILSLADNPEVFEAFGHNQLLYLADKAVKAEVRMLRSSLRGIADLSVGGVSSRRKIFGLVSTYREQRADAEQARMRGGGRW